MRMMHASQQSAALKVAKKATTLLIALLFVLVQVPSSVFAADPITIDNCEQLKSIGVNEDYPLDGDYKVMANLDCTSEDIVGDEHYSQDFEDGATGWTSSGVEVEGDPETGNGLMTNTWNLMTETCGLDTVENSPFQFESTVYGTNGNAGPDCEEESNDEDSYLLSPQISLPATDIGWVVQFDSWAYDEGGPCVDSGDIDSKDIAVTTDGGTSAAPLNDCYELHDFTADDDQIDHKVQRFSLSSYSEQDIQLMFRYFTSDSCCETDLGWFIDNVVIYEGTISSFNGIGDGDNYFTGTFDGQNHTISNLEIQSDDSYGGLFNYVDEGAVVKNIRLLSGAIQASSSGTGTLAGRNYGTIENAHSSISVEGEDRVGGLVGRNYGTVKRSSATGKVSSTGGPAGGLVGRNQGLIEESWSHNDPGDGDYGVEAECHGGGLVGYHAEEAIIRNSFSRSNVSDADECSAGGLVGEADYNSEITNSYSTGTASSDGNAGGLIGNARETTSISYSFWDKETSGFPYACGWQEGALECDHPTRAQGKTTVDMKNKASFTTDLGANSWDFTTIWNIDGTTNDGYPFFTTSSPAADGDDDGISDAIEDAGPNNGDANKDGVPDSEQGNIASLPNQLTGQYVALEVDEACTIESVAILAESQVTSKQDSVYNYPAGLVDFTLDCGEDGFTTNVTLYHYGVTGNFALRKFKPSTGFFTINTASVSSMPLSDPPVKVATYQITDGGELDLDGEENGIIVDPVGLGQGASSASLASTGQSTQSLLGIILVILITSGVGVFLIRRQQTLS